MKFKLPKLKKKKQAPPLGTYTKRITCWNCWCIFTTAIPRGILVQHHKTTCPYCKCEVSRE